MALRLMGRDLRRRLFDSDTPLLVAHPTLVGILAGRSNLLYQHGEVSAPKESLVTGATMTFVPTREVAEQFVKAGCSGESVIVTGLCVEPSLVRQAEDAWQLRKARLEGRQPLTGAFFSSGAEPTPHIRQLATAALSAVREGHRVVVFAQHGGRFERQLETQFHEAGVRPHCVDSRDTPLSEPSPLILVSYQSRRELAALTARFFPQFDFQVAPSHERVNWALGLGLPLFVVEPCIGPFAGLNNILVLKQGVAVRLNELGAEQFGPRLTGMRQDGRLAAMATAGWGRQPIDGFERIAAYLVERFGG